MANKNTCDYLVFDITNILYRTFFVHKAEDALTIAGLAHHTALSSVNKYFNDFNPKKKIIMCFDRTSWRKKYTASSECISAKPYKGTRRQKMSPADKEKYMCFIDHIAEFELLIKNHTSIHTLAGDGLEADDLIAGVVQTLTTGGSNNEIVIISADKDMIQLLDYPNVRLINPADGKDRTLDEWNGDARLFMFEKCIRGDTGDNVQSALPRCRKKRIHNAYTDSYDCANLMNTTWTDQHGTEYVVKQLFKENELLMDLNKQPDDIQHQIITTVLTELNNHVPFSFFHFLQFLGKYELKKVTQNVERFTTMLSH
jgi:hypothetical protein